MEQNDISKITVVKEVHSEHEANQHLGTGWILLSVASAGGLDGRDAYVLTRYVLGKP